ncbi:hypothetical protein AcV7_009409 [Taiwanofungus camphoratus]|nr:hypothetical protein AcV7_009409 [Antrodia cinnamomea]
MARLLYLILYNPFSTTSYSLGDELHMSPSSPNTPTSHLADAPESMINSPSTPTRSSDSDDGTDLDTPKARQRVTNLRALPSLVSTVIPTPAPKHSGIPRFVQIKKSKVDQPPQHTSLHRYPDNLISTPFARPHPTDIQTLYDLMLVALPPTPSAFNKDKLQATKQISDSEMKLGIADQLTKVVHLPRLVAQLFGEASRNLDKIRIHWGNPEEEHAIARIHPYLTSALLPRMIWSEKDIEDWCLSTLFRPALAAVSSVLKGHIDTDLDSSFPYLSSSPNGPTIPDGILVCYGNDVTTLKVGITIENKTPSAWFDQTTHQTMFADLQNYPGGVLEGRGMKFNWPEASNNNDAQTRIIVQVWFQIVKYKCRLGILSTHESTIFLARGEGRDKDALFISSSYGRDDCPMLAVFCWFALAVGILKLEDLNLPEVDTDWWSAEVKNGLYDAKTGIVLPTTYAYKPQLSARQIVIRDAQGRRN